MPVLADDPEATAAFQILAGERPLPQCKDRTALLTFHRAVLREAMDRAWATSEGRSLANAFRRSCTDGVSAVATAAWLSLRMIGSDAPRGRKTANRVGASKSASPCSWARARFGKAA